jgi:hypothetical protein
MSEITNSTFDYGCLAHTEAATLRQDALRLRGLVTKTTANMIEVGQDLVAIKDRLNHGQFTSWVEAEIGISIRTAQGYMRFAMLAEGKSETVALLPPSTARMLASKSTPPEIVQQVIAKAATGNIVPDRVVRDLISERQFELRRAAAAARQIERKARRPKSVREREERERQAYRAERERERAETTARAQAIIDRFSPEDVRFIADTLTWETLDEFRRLVAEGGAA